MLCVCLGEGEAWPFRRLINRWTNWGVPGCGYQANTLTDTFSHSRGLRRGRGGRIGRPGKLWLSNNVQHEHAGSKSWLKIVYMLGYRYSCTHLQTRTQRPRTTQYKKTLTYSNICTYSGLFRIPNGFPGNTKQKKKKGTSQGKTC